MTVLLPSLAFELVTAEEMTRRRVRFIEKLNGGYQGPIIIAEGDSWFCYPRDSIWVPDTAPVDVITQLSQEFAISALGRPGDTSQNMADFFSSVATDIQTWEADILLLSAGGNDLLGGGALESVLRPGDRPVGQYLAPEFFARVELVIQRIERMMREARTASGDLKIALHGYDYALPSGRGPWLRAPMDRLGIPRAKHGAIIRRIVNAFYSRLAALVDTLDDELAGGNGEIVLVDLRGTVGAGEWHDELHPTTAGFARVRDALRETILKLHPLVA